MYNVYSVLGWRKNHDALDFRNDICVIECHLVTPAVTCKVK